MNLRMTACTIASLVIAGGLLLNDGVSNHATSRMARAEETSAPDSKPLDDIAQSEVDARGRARLFHEMVHGALQVMHRDFFREDEGLKIPSSPLDDVHRPQAEDSIRDCGRQSAGRRQVGI